jgi:hypothetical protein
MINYSFAAIIRGSNNFAPDRKYSCQIIWPSLFSPLILFITLAYQFTANLVCLILLKWCMYTILSKNCLFKRTVLFINIVDLGCWTCVDHKCSQTWDCAIKLLSTFAVIWRIDMILLRYASYMYWLFCDVVSLQPVLLAFICLSFSFWHALALYPSGPVLKLQQKYQGSCSGNIWQEVNMFLEVLPLQPRV